MTSSPIKVQQYEFQGNVADYLHCQEDDLYFVTGWDIGRRHLAFCTVAVSKQDIDQFKKRTKSDGLQGSGNTRPSLEPREVALAQAQRFWSSQRRAGEARREFSSVPPFVSKDNPFCIPFCIVRIQVLDLSPKIRQAISHIPRLFDERPFLFDSKTKSVVIESQLGINPQACQMMASVETVFLQWKYGLAKNEKIKVAVNTMSSRKKFGVYNGPSLDLPRGESSKKKRLDKLRSAYAGQYLCWHQRPVFNYLHQLDDKMDDATDSMLLALRELMDKMGVPPYMILELEKGQNEDVGEEEEEEEEEEEDIEDEDDDDHEPIARKQRPSKKKRSNPRIVEDPVIVITDTEDEEAFLNCLVAPPPWKRKRILD